MARLALLLLLSLLALPALASAAQSTPPLNFSSAHYNSYGQAVAACAVCTKSVIPIGEPYGLVPATAAGNVVYYPYKLNNTLYVYNVSVQKASSSPCIYLSVAPSPYCTNATTPAQVRFVVTQKMQSQGYYPLNITFLASLLAGNSADFNFTVQDLTNGTTLTPLTKLGAVNAVNVQESFRIKTTHQVEITFSSGGDANYSKVVDDPVTTPTSVAEWLPANTLASSATPSNLQVLYVFNAIPYNPYESSSMQNFVAFNGVSGSAYNCWLEGNVLNEQQTTSLYTSNALGIWCKIPESGWIANNNIYFGFYPTSTNNFNGIGNWGEAPQLSSSYGQYDNGNVVFSMYQNFAGSGTTPKGWYQSGASTYNNGLVISTSGTGISENTTTFSQSAYTLDSYYKVSAFGPDYDGEGVEWASTYNTMGDNVGLFSTGSDLGVGYFTGSSGISSGLGVSAGTYNVFTTYATSSTAYAQMNYGAPVSVAVATSYTYPYPVMWLQVSGSTTLNAAWIRARVSPPSHANPTVTYGALASASSSPSATQPSITYPVVDVGQTETISSTAISGTGNYVGNFLITNSGTVTHTLPVPSQPSGSLSKSWTVAAGEIGTETGNFIGTDSNTVPNAFNSIPSASFGVYAALTAVAISPATTQYISGGGSVAFTSSVTGGAGAINYQWRSDAASCTGSSSTIGGATTSAYTASPASNTFYCLTVTDSATSNEVLTSAQTEVVVVPPPGAIPIYLQNATANPMATFPPASTCGTNFLGGNCIGTDLITGTQSLTNNLVILGGVQLASGAVLTTNGYYMIMTGTFNSLLGAISTGYVGNGGAAVQASTGNAGGSYLSSNAGAGGGGGGAGGSSGNGGAGGSTVLSTGGGGGQGGTGGNAGGTYGPSLSNSILLSWFNSGMNNHVNAAGGGSGGSQTGNGGAGGSGAYGLFVQANNCEFGTVNAPGQNGFNGQSYSGGGGGGGGGELIFACGNGGYTAGTYNSIGGVGGVGSGGGGSGGSGSNGQEAEFSYGSSTVQPIPIVFFSTHYPIQLYTTQSSPTVTFALSQTFNGATTSLVSGASSLSYIPPPNQLSGTYAYTIVETNTLTLGTNTILANVTVNMIDISSALTYNTPIIQYLSNIAYCPTWGATPVSWSIRSDLAANQNSNQSNPCGEVFSNANLTFIPQITLNYGFTSFTANVANNPLIASITQSQFGLSASTNSLYAREIINSSAYDQQFFTSVNSLSYLSVNFIVNGYTTGTKNANMTANVVKGYVPQSNYLNPPMKLVNPAVASTGVAAHVGITNNFCNTTLLAGNFMTYKEYLPNNANSSTYSININQGFAAGDIGGYFVAYSGVPSRQVQISRIGSQPYGAVLQINQPYQFLIYNPACQQIYQSQLSIWPPPTITIGLNSTGIGAILKTAKPVNNCAFAVNSLNANTLILSCIGNDTTYQTVSWRIQVNNASAMIQPAYYGNLTIAGSSYSYNAFGAIPASGAVINVKVVATDGNGNQYPFYYSRGLQPSNGFQLPTSGLIEVMLLLLCVGAGVTMSKGQASNMQLAITLYLIGFMLVITYEIGIIKVLGPVIAGGLAFTAFALGFMTQRYQASGMGLFPGG